MTDNDLTELNVEDHMHIEHEREDHGGHDTEQPERQMSERDRMMAEISQRRAEAIDKELRYGENLQDEARERAGLEARPHDEDQAEPSPLDTAATEALKKPAEAPKPRQNLHTVELDGQVYQVTDEQFQELAKLGARTNVAMARQQQAAQPANNQQNAQRSQQQAPQPQQPNNQRRVLSKADSEAVADRLLYGGRDQVAQTVEALAYHIAQQSRQEQIDGEKVAQEAARRAMEYTQLNDDLKTISGEYPTLWTDRILGELAAVQLSHVRSEDQATGKSRTNLDSYREACNRTLEAIGQPRPNGSVKPATQAATSRVVSTQPGDRSATLERKRVAKSEPSSIDRRASAPTTTRPLTGSEIVAQMRKSRHQPAYN